MGRKRTSVSTSRCRAQPCLMMNQPQPRRAIQTVGAALVRTRRASRTVCPAFPQTPLTVRAICDRVRQGGFQSGCYLLHFRESRCLLPRVYVGLTPGESYYAREWGKVDFNPDAICYTSVSQGGKCGVFMWVWHKKKLYGTRVGQGGFQTGRYLLHFHESRWQI